MKTAAIALIVLLEVGCIQAYDSSAAHDPAKKEQKAEKKKGKDKKDKPAKSPAASSDITVLKSWKMPSVLKELSGHAIVDAERFACIQDESGNIFIYNRSSGSVEQEIPFAEAGDYEDIAIVGSTAYVLRSDGTVYEVANYRNGKPTTRTHKTSLTTKQDVEGLSYDPKHNRLLISVKAKDPNSADYKGVYAFDLATKSLGSAPVYKLNLSDPMLQGGEKKSKTPMPSAIAIHPTTSDLYIVDGPGKRLFIMGQNSKLKSMYSLAGDLVQPEGIAIDGSGKIFISSEGGKGDGIIVEAALN